MRAEDRLTPPASFLRQYSGRLVHSKAGVEQNTKQEKIITAAVNSMKNVEGLLRSLESDAICTTPLMKIGLASAILYRNLMQRRARRKRLPAVEVVGENDLIELQYFHSSSSVPIKQIPKNRSEDSTLINRICQGRFHRLSA